MHQKMSRGLKFRIKEEEKLYCLCSENKDDDKLSGDHGANLRLSSRICKKQVFSCGSIIDKVIGEFLLQFSIYLIQFLNRY